MVLCVQYQVLIRLIIFRVNTMCYENGSFYCFNLAAIVIITVLLFQNSNDEANLKNNLDYVKRTSIDNLECITLCPNYPYQLAQQCCYTYYSPNCESKTDCLYNYISYKQDQLGNMQTQFFYYIIIDVLLCFILVVKACGCCCKRGRRQEEQQELARHRAIMALLFAAREHAANQQANQPERSILTQSFIAQDKGENCAICMDAFEEERVVRLPCGHMYHRACIQAWINRGDASCPICRAPQ